MKDPSEDIAAVVFGPRPACSTEAFASPAQIEGRSQTRREHLRLALESRQSIRIVRQCIGEDLDGDVALQPRVARAVDLAHSARANERGDLVRAEPCAGGQ